MRQPRWGIFILIPLLFRGDRGDLGAVPSKMTLVVVGQVHPGVSYRRTSKEDPWAPNMLGEVG